MIENLYQTEHGFVVHITLVTNFQE